jgi:hypothetical protein
MSESRPLPADADLRPRYGRVFLTFARNSLVRDMTFRTNFIFQCISSVCWTLMNVGFYLIIFQFTSSIVDGWQKPEFFLFLATTWFINSIVQASRGMEKLHEYVDSALNSATDAEHAIQQKPSILSMSRSVLDEEDTDWIRESMKCDTRRLLLIMKWMNGVMEDLMQLIRQRLDVESNLQEIPRGGCSAVIAKMHTKTMKMKTIYSVMSSRVDCIMVPPEYADLP